MTLETTWYDVDTISAWPTVSPSITAGSGGGGAMGTMYSVPPNVSISNNTGPSPLTWASYAAPSTGLTVEGDIRWQGRSLSKWLEKIEDRLAILSDPDPEKLEKFAALKKAYEHYKLLEKLIGDEGDAD